MKHLTNIEKFKLYTLTSLILYEYSRNKDSSEEYTINGNDENHKYWKTSNLLWNIEGVLIRIR